MASGGLLISLPLSPIFLHHTCVYILIIFELGDNGSVVETFLHPGPTEVSLASRRVEKVLNADPVKKMEIMN